MSCEEKFNAAVSVIRNLPKNGSYQPSHELMLRFYAYYKQATEGPAKGQRPGFWDVIKRAKWDAWAKLGDMSREEAMRRYVEELNKIVETMALTDKVADFLTSLDSFSGTVEDIEMCMGPTLEKVRSQPGSPLSNSPLGSRDTSPIRSRLSPVSSIVSQVEPDDDEDDFLDSVEQAESLEKSSIKEKRKDLQQLSNGITQFSMDSKLPNGYVNENKRIHHDTVSEVLQRAVESLRRDLTSLSDRTQVIEDRQNKVFKRSKYLFGNMSRQTIAFIVLWPIFIHYVLNWLRNRRSKSIL
ncbi:hypothetical protein O3M35_013021 [Rhynocoris fuscipes]|uniref:ACB domain-containing protein n=1 Tax=Rhynocoris fuscipes TaxID=488301 RepID=A0AAW1CIY5_9HEMI